MADNIKALGAQKPNRPFSRSSGPNKRKQPWVTTTVGARVPPGTRFLQVGAIQKQVPEGRPAQENSQATEPVKTLDSMGDLEKQKELLYPTSGYKRARVASNEAA